MASRYPGNASAAAALPPAARCPSPQGPRAAPDGVDAEPGGPLLSSGAESTFVRSDGHATSPQRSRGVATRPRPAPQVPSSVPTGCPPALQRSATPTGPASDFGNTDMRRSNGHGSRPRSPPQDAPELAASGPRGSRGRSGTGASVASTVASPLASPPVAAAARPELVLPPRPNPHLRRHGARSGSIVESHRDPLQGPPASESDGSASGRPAAAPDSACGLPAQRSASGRSQGGMPARGAGPAASSAVLAAAERINSGSLRSAPRQCRSSFAGMVVNDSFPSSPHAATVESPPAPSAAEPQLAPVQQPARSSGRRTRPSSGSGGTTTTNIFERLHWHHQERQRALEQTRDEAWRAWEEQERQQERQCTFEPNRDRRLKQGDAGPPDAVSVSNRLFQQRTAAREAQLSRAQDPGPGPGSYTPSVTETREVSTHGPTTIPTAGLGQSHRSVDRTSIVSSHGSGGSSGQGTSAHQRSPPNSGRTSTTQSSGPAAAARPRGGSRVQPAQQPARGHGASRSPRSAKPQRQQVRTTSPAPRGAAQSLALVMSGARPGVNGTTVRRSQSKLGDSTATGDAAGDSGSRGGSDQESMAGSGDSAAAVAPPKPVALAFKPRVQHRLAASAASISAAAAVAAACAMRREESSGSSRQKAAGPWGSPRQGGSSGKKGVKFDLTIKPTHRQTVSWDSHTGVSVSSHGDDPPTEACSDATPRERAFSTRTADVTRGMGRCIECGQLLPSEMPFCPATGRKHGTMARAVAVVQHGGGAGGGGSAGAPKLRRTGSASQSCMSYEQSEGDCATAIDRGSVAASEEVGPSYSLALRSIKGRNHDLSLRELLAAGLGRPGARSSGPSPVCEETSTVVTDTGTNTPSG
eukprot:TRINITY_DN24756_c0_g1_i1.p1 TRINITY_DN24756_c0_g1~~TRINITY_DN24756_c0_g1_i1.p1  ORF type:complete len:868 (+),score=128.83 TRINITY_DN24756_c0_g1_i1:205-2808(+)